MKAGVAISLAGHAALLIWSVWSFAVKPLEAKSVESVPVDVISEKDFSQITAGQKNAKPAETPPKPLVEKVAEKNKVEDPAPKPTEKKEVVAAQEAPTPPPQPKQDAKPDPKPEKKEPDQIAEALKKEKAKPQPVEKKQPIPVPPKFDPMKIAALLNKQEPKRVAAAGDQVNHNVSLGLSSGTASTLSQSELDALRARLAQLWNPPAGAKNPEQLVVLVRIQLTRDGKLAAPPVVLTSGTNPLFVAARDSAIRAIFRGQPYDMLRQETYETWKDVEVTFDPRQMFGG